MREAVRIVPYDPEWVNAYERIAHDVTHIAEKIAHRVEHIGSTAVPHMEAKPIIDIVVGLEGREDLESMCRKLSRQGYEHQESSSPEEDQRFLVGRESQGGCRTHVHLVLMGGRQWQELLAFRDALRASDELAGRYLALKRQLARAFPLDVEAYASSKGEFVSRALRVES